MPPADYAAERLEQSVVERQAARRTGSVAAVSA
jgi:hypothetical protein